MPTQYKFNDIQFMYPDNWRLVEDARDELPRIVTLETPTGGMWLLHILDVNDDLDARMKEIIRELDEQFDSLEVTPTSQQIGPYDCIGFDAHFFCLDLLVTAQIRAVQTESCKFVIVSQAENRDFDENEPVFGAINFSLLSPNVPAT